MNKFANMIKIRTRTRLSYMQLDKYKSKKYYTTRNNYIKEEEILNTYKGNYKSSDLWNDLPLISKVIPNREYIDGQTLEMLDTRFKNMLIFLIAVNKYLGKRSNKKIIAQIESNLKRMQINEDDIANIKKWIKKYSTENLDDYKNLDVVINVNRDIKSFDDLILVLLEKSDKRNCILNDEVIIKLKRVILWISNICDEETIKICNKRFVETIDQFNNVATVKQDKKIKRKKTYWKW